MKTRNLLKALGLIGAAAAGIITTWSFFTSIAMIPTRLSAAEQRIAENEKRQQTIYDIAVRVDENVKWLMQREDMRSGFSPSAAPTPPSSGR